MDKQFSDAVPEQAGVVGGGEHGADAMAIAALEIRALKRSGATCLPKSKKAFLAATTKPHILGQRSEAMKFSPRLGKALVLTRR